MNSPARTTLTWLGRFFLLAVPFVILCGLYYPKGIQFLDPIACKQGLSLSNLGYDRDTPFDNRAVCQSEAEIEGATSRIIAIAGASFGLAVAAYSLRSRITPHTLYAPNALHG